MKNTEFRIEYASYKSKIDQEILKYSKRIISNTEKEYGYIPAEAVKTYCEILSRGGRRLRGVLAMNSYYMFGGEDEDVALKAGLVIEMLQAYILMADDIQDRSDLRRGGASAHKLLEKYHASLKLKGDSEHFGISLTINSFLFGVHSAINVIANLPIEAQRKIDAISNINDNFIKTSHGQSLDIFNEVVEEVTEEDIDRVMLLKTAHYTFLNPLQLGGILAGANKKELKKLENFALSAGRAFQIQNDIDGIFGDQLSTGKSPYDDIKEGKKTLLIIKAIEFSNNDDSRFLKTMLGNKKVTKSEFNKLKRLIKECRAEEYSRNEVKRSANQASEALKKLGRSNSGQLVFLDALVNEIAL